MKAIRSIIAIIAIVLISGLSLNNCTKNTETPQSTPNNSVPVSSIDTAGIKDTVTLKIVASINTLNNRMCYTTEEIKHMQDSITELQKTEKMLWSAIGLITIIALILMALCIKFYSILKRQNNSRKSATQEQIKDKQTEPYRPRPVTVEKSYVTVEIKDLEQRVAKIEALLKKLNTEDNSKQQPNQKSPGTVPPPTVNIIPPQEKIPEEEKSISIPTKKGYFGNPAPSDKPYFKRLYNSPDSEARFSVEISGDKAHFRPLDSSKYIGTFISNDAMRTAIEFTGCNPSEHPNSMRVIMPGEAVLENGKWFIIKKSQVYLSR